MYVCMYVQGLDNDTETLANIVLEVSHLYMYVQSGGQSTLITQSISRSECEV